MKCRVSAGSVPWKLSTPRVESTRTWEAATADELTWAAPGWARMAPRRVTEVTDERMVPAGPRTGHRPSVARRIPVLAVAR